MRPGLSRNGLLVFRYLESLVAAYRALGQLSQQSKAVLSNVQVTLVTLAPPEDDEKKIEPSHVQEI